MRSGYLREGLWQQVYLLEFYEDADGKVLGDSFAFGVPPESEEITLLQRKSEVKTFGGLVVDDYGCHELKIVLTGSTVNNELRRIYHTDGAMEYVSGEDEIFMLKALIEKYKNEPYLMGKKILLYDLSKQAARKIDRTVVDSFCWQVFPGELKIKRSKERPFTYTYSLEFTAVSAVSMFVWKNAVNFENVVFGFDFNQAFDKITASFDKATKKLSDLKIAVNAITDARRFIQKCKEVVLLATGGTADLLHTMIDDTFAIGSGVFELYRETVGGAVPFAIDNADFAAAVLIDLLRNMQSLVANIKSATKKDFYIPTGLFDDWDIVKEEVENLSELFLGQACSTINRMIVSNKRERPREQQLQVGKDAAITIYGVKMALISDGLNFESLAQSYYGDAGKAFIIASANKASSIEDLIKRNGRYIVIPVLEKSKAHLNNRIIGLSAQRDNYGKDIALDEYGNILLRHDGSDFQFVSGKANLSQSILMRLRENVHKRVKLQVYGIKTTIPDSEAAGSAYILSSIIETLKQEPRIKELLKVSFRGEGDALRIDIDYTDIGGSRNTVLGVI